MTADAAASLAWPLLLGIGVIRASRGSFSFYAPITTGVIVSIVISLIVSLWRH